MKHLAIVPARSGSKGLPHKNIKALLGKPLMAYSIQSALQTGIFSEVLCSTDSSDYAEIAVKWGATVPFLRSTEASGDTASSWDVVREVLQLYQRRCITFDTVALLQPTSPLRNEQDILGGYAVLEERNASTVISVCEVDHSPLWNGILDDYGSMKNFGVSELAQLPRQMLPTYYRINGALYIRRITTLAHDEDLFAKKCYAYVMDRERSIDIDNELDFQFAEAVLRHRKLLRPY